MFFHFWGLFLEWDREAEIWEEGGGEKRGMVCFPACGEDEGV
jgi:hypothetical protein